MFTIENFKSLIGIKDRNELMRAISQMTEEDLRAALTLATAKKCSKTMLLRMIKTEHDFLLKMQKKMQNPILIFFRPAYKPKIYILK